MLQTDIDDTLAIERLAGTVAGHIRELRADMKTAPGALADSASALGIRAAVSLFYKIPGWLMAPAICATWAAAVSARAMRKRGPLS